MKKRMNKTKKELTKITKRKKRETCAICLEPTYKTIKCGHHFHKKCLDKWKEHNSCPVCRKPIDETKEVKKCRYDNEEEDVRMAREIASEMPQGMFQGMDDIIWLEQGLLALANANTTISERLFENHINRILVRCTVCKAELGQDFPVISCSHCNEGLFCCNICMDHCPCRGIRPRVSNRRAYRVDRRNHLQDRENMVQQVEADMAEHKVGNIENIVENEGNSLEEFVENEAENEAENVVENRLVTEDERVYGIKPIL